MDNDNLVFLKENIEKMSRLHQIEILNILVKNKNITLNENDNGIFVNLNEIDTDTLKKLSDYIQYVNKQEDHLQKIENQKDVIENTYFK